MNNQSNAPAEVNQQQTNDELVERVTQTPELLERVLQTPEVSGALAVLVQQQISHSGPLPMADEMRKYNEVIPHGADRIMKLAENEQKNRYSIPKWSLFLKGIGLLFGMVSVSLVVWFCFKLIEKEQYGLAVTTMCGVLVALAGVFVAGKVLPQNKKETG